MGVFMRGGTSAEDCSDSWAPVNHRGVMVRTKSRFTSNGTACNVSFLFCCLTSNGVLSMANTRVWRMPFPRDRFDGAITRPTVSQGTTAVTLGTTPGTFVTTPGGPRPLAHEGEIRRCIDVVTPGYQQLVSDGLVVNSPFTSIRCTCTQGGLGQKTQYTGSLKPWNPGASYSLDVVSTLRTYDSRYAGLGAMFDASGPLYVATWASLVDISRGLTIAKTSAMSKVDQSLASGLVGLGELKQTLQMLLRPLSNIRELMRRMRFGPKSNKGVLKDPLGAGANDYLAFYYGLLPFCRDIESYLDAYVKSGAQAERITARGGADERQSREESQSWAPIVGTSTYSHKFTRKEELEVRSGILYVPSPLTWQKVYGVRYSDFFDAAYQLTPWSFFVDYFSNLGKLVNALTPREGVRYLAAWDRYTLTITERAECTGGGMGGPWSWSRQNTEWAQRVVKATVRFPASATSGAGLALKTGDWSSKTKVLAVLSLIIQQLTK